MPAAAGPRCQVAVAGASAAVAAPSASTAAHVIRIPLYHRTPAARSGGWSHVITGQVYDDQKQNAVRNQRTSLSQGPLSGSETHTVTPPKKHKFSTVF